MTLAGTPRALDSRRSRSAMRTSGIILMALAVSAVVAAFFAVNRFPAILMSILVAANIAHKAGWSLWAVRTRKLAGTKLLGLFAVILSVGWVIAAWYTEGGPTTYFWTTVVIGSSLVLVAGFDASISPDDARATAVGPRVADAVSPLDKDDRRDPRGPRP